MDQTYSKIGKKTLQFRITKSFLLASIRSLVLTAIIGAWFLLHKQIVITIFIYNVLFLLQFAWGVSVSYLEYKNTGYIISVSALVYRSGIFSTHETSIPYSKIINATFNQTFFQRILKIGNITITQDDTTFTIKNIDQQTADKIMQEISSRSNVQPILNVK